MTRVWFNGGPLDAYEVDIVGDTPPPELTLRLSGDVPRNEGDIPVVAAASWVYEHVAGTDSYRPKRVQR